MDDANFVWDIAGSSFPATKLTITVAGYSHTIDLTEIRDVTSIEGQGNTEIKADDVAKFINARMQDYDVRAEINEDKELMLWSKRGYSLEVAFADANGDVTANFMGDEASSRSYYRGGYNLDGDATTRGIDANDFYQYGLHSQNATVRSGANTMKQNGFGVINDVIAAIESGNRDDLADKLLPKIDDFISNILSVMSENGALQARYEYNGEKLTQESAIMTESYDDLVKIDPADAISQLMVADYMYQANLAVISRLIQPSLLDFLG
jgi:flagellar hook-associated protein 3 FlgL